MRTLAQKARRRELDALNREHILERKRKWNEANKDRIKECRRKRYLQRGDEIREIKNAWNEKNREKVREQKREANRKYREANREKLREKNILYKRLKRGVFTARDAMIARSKGKWKLICSRGKPYIEDYLRRAKPVMKVFFREWFNASRFELGFADWRLDESMILVPYITFR